jgi:hypothetical protein
MTAYVKRVAVWAAVIPLLAALSPSPASAQKLRDRVIERVVSPDEPVKISAMKVRGVAVEPGKKFKGDEDWLSGLTLSVTNTSDKAICFINIALDLTAAAAAEPGLRDRLVWGCRQPAAEGASGLERPKHLAPGESVEIALSKEQYAEAREQLRRTNHPAGIDRVDITVDEVGFEGEEDTRWSGGRMMRRDRDDPNRWHPVRPPGK